MSSSLDCLALANPFHFGVCLRRIGRTGSKPKIYPTLCLVIYLLADWSKTLPRFAKLTSCKKPTSMTQQNRKPHTRQTGAAFLLCFVLLYFYLCLLTVDHCFRKCTKGQRYALPNPSTTLTLKAQRHNLKCNMHFCFPCLPSAAPSLLTGFPHCTQSEGHC